MDKNLMLVIKTNLYTGNFERELMGYVFGYDQDGMGYAYSELEHFSEEMGELWREKLLEYLDTRACGQSYGEYSCYEINSHPNNKDYDCDSIFVGLQKAFPKDVASALVNRLNDFCDYYVKKYKDDLKILDIDYYQRKTEIQKDENLSFEV